MIQLDFNQLRSIPYISQFDDTFEQQVNQYIQDWQPYEQYYDQIALIRAIECTNGCVQYALRDQHPKALPIEQSRECMKLSMGFILSKTLTLPDQIITIDPILYPKLDEVREYYIQGFKQHNSQALQSFYAQSVAQFNVLQKPLITQASQFVRTHFTYPFTDYFLTKGQEYMLKFLAVTTHV